MAEPVTLASLKVHLRLEAGASAEDGWLTDRIVAARRAIERHTNQIIVGDGSTLSDDDLPLAAEAILLLAAYWYDNRDAAGAIPDTLCDLTLPLYRWTL